MGNAASSHYELGNLEEPVVRIRRQEVSTQEKRSWAAAQGAHTRKGTEGARRAAGETDIGSSQVPKHHHSSHFLLLPKTNAHFSVITDKGSL